MNLEKKFFWFVFISIFTGCSNARLHYLESPSLTLSQSGEFCTSASELENGYVKYLFVVDKSESNYNSDYLNGRGTDADGSRRIQPIRKFFEEHQDPKYFWGYIAFSTQARAYINGGADTDPIFVNKESNPDSVVQMNAALARQLSEKDGGGTGYLNALDLAKRAIQRDIQLNPTQNNQYVVFHITDGLPSDGPLKEGPPADVHFKKVEELLQVRAGAIRLSTAYYGPTNVPGAVEGLAEMAKRGNGKFVDMNKNPDFEFDDLLVPGSTVPYRLKNFYSFLVYNLNSAVCWNQQYGLDSDSDGMCDEDEEYLAAHGYNFDSKNRFSSGDGYGDYFHYVALMTRTPLNPCSDRSDEDFDLLTKCEETYVKNSNSHFDRMDADPKNADTDGDGTIDGIETLVLKNRSAAVDETNLFKHYDSDPLNALEQILTHRNPLHPDFHKNPEELYDTNLLFKGMSDRGQHCYSVSQNYLKTYASKAVLAQDTLAELAHGENENVILISFQEVPEDKPEAGGNYRFSFHRVNHDSMAKNLSFSESEFRTYIMPDPVRKK